MKTQSSTGVQGAVTCLKFVKAFVYQKIRQFF